MKKTEVRFLEPAVQRLFQIDRNDRYNIMFLLIKAAAQDINIPSTLARSFLLAEYYENNGVDKLDPTLRYTLISGESVAINAEAEEFMNTAKSIVATKNSFDNGLKAAFDLMPMSASKALRCSLSDAYRDDVIPFMAYFLSKCAEDLNHFYKFEGIHSLTPDSIQELLKELRNLLEARKEELTAHSKF